MNHEDAIEDLYYEYNHIGSEKIEEFLFRDISSGLREQSIATLTEVVDILGEDRVRQLLGLDGEPWITVCTVMGNKQAEKQWEGLRSRLETLWQEGLIANYSRQMVTQSADTDDCDNMLTEAVEQYRIWAARNNLTVDPFFRKIENEGKYAIPNTFLEVKSSLGRLHTIPTSDKDPSVLEGVFPCADDKRQYEIEDYLKALEEGVGWREYQEVGSLSTPDHGGHGSIKSHIFQNPSTTVGEEWTPIEDEQQVGPMLSDDNGRVDLVFKNKTKEKFLLVQLQR